MGFDVAGALRAGYSQEEIVEHLAKKRGFNARAALEAGYNPTELIDYLSKPKPKTPATPTAPVVKPEENLLEQIPVIGSALAGAADVPVKFAQGLAATGQTFTDLFGAGNVASKKLAEAQDFLERFTSSASRGDARTNAKMIAEAKGKGMGEEALAYLKAFANSPVDYLSQGAGSIVPFIAASFAGAPAAVGLGVASGAGAIKGGVYDTVKNELISAGVDPAKAEAAAEQAQSYGGENLDQIALGGILGAVEAFTGPIGKNAGPVINKILRRVGTEVTEKTGKRLGREAAKGFAKEASAEFLQSGQQKLAENVALQREGFDVPTLEGVIGSGLQGAITGGILGGGLSAGKTMAERRVAREAEITDRRLSEAAARGDMDELELIRQDAIRKFTDLGLDETIATDYATKMVNAEVAKRQKAEEAPPVTEEAAPAGTQEAAPPPTMEQAPAPGMVSEQLTQEELAAPPPTEEAGFPGEPTAEEVVPDEIAQLRASRDNLERLLDDDNRLMMVSEQSGTNVDEVIQTLREQIDAINTQLSAPAPKPTPLSINEPVAAPDYAALQEKNPEPSLLDAINVAQQTQEAPPTVVDTATAKKVTSAQPAQEGEQLTLQPIEGQEQLEEGPVLTFDEIAQNRVSELQANLDAADAGYIVDYDPNRSYPYQAYTKVPDEDGEPTKGKLVARSTKYRTVADKVQSMSPFVYKTETEQFVEEGGVSPEEGQILSADKVAEGETAGDLTEGQRQQVELLNRIDDARNKRQITDNERANLVGLFSIPKEAFAEDKTTGQSAVDPTKLPQEWKAVLSAQRVANETAEQLQPDLIAANDTYGEVREQAIKNYLNEGLKRGEAEKAADNLPAVKRAKKAATNIQGQIDAKQRAADRMYLSNILGKIERELKAKARARGKLIEKGVRKAVKSKTEAKRREGRIEAREARPQRAGLPSLSGAQGNVTADDLDAVITPITSSWKAKVKTVIVQSVDDLPANLQQIVADLQVDGALVPAMYDKGTLYFIADNMASPDEAIGALFHEGLAHFGLFEAFSRQLDNILSAIYNANDTIRELADAYLAKYPQAYSATQYTPEQQRARATEEILASMSERGRYEDVKLFDQLKALFKAFLNRMGMTSVKLTDEDVASILTIAHDRVISNKWMLGKATRVFFAGRTSFERRMGMPSVKPDTSESEVEKLKKANRRASIGRRTLEASKEIDEVPDALGDMTEGGHSLKDFTGALSDNLEAISDANLARLLYVMPTSGVVGWMGDRIPRIKEIRDLTAKMLNQKQNVLRAGEKTAKEIEKFVNKHGSAPLANALHIARLNEFSPQAHKTLADALKNDEPLQYIKMLLGKTKNTSKIKDLQDQVSKREAAIRDTWAYWEDLGKLEGGQKLFEDITDYYRNMYTLVRGLLDRRIEDMKIDGERKDKLLKSVRMEEELAKGDENSPFPEVPRGLFPQQYTPYKRDGKYWLRVKPSAKDQKRFWVFESAKERNAAERRIAQKLGLSKQSEDYSQFIQSGNDISTLRENFDMEGSMLQRIFETISEAKADARTGVVDMDQLQDSIYQIYLLSLPERSIRKQFIHSENVPGMSMDILRNFTNSVSEYANQVAKLAYSNDINNSISAAFDSLADDPDRKKLEPFVQSMADRALFEIDPPEQNDLVNELNRVSFLMFLTSGATAFTQSSGIPIRVMPRLWREYGFARGTQKWLKYMQVWKTYGVTTEEPDGRLAYTAPTVGEADMVRTNPSLLRGFKLGLQMNAFDTLSSALLENRPSEAKGVIGQAGRWYGKTVEYMGAFFTASERMTREAAYMMAFELELENLKKKAGKVDDAGLIELEKQAAQKAFEVTDDTLGNYTSLERPPLMKNELARAVFLFKHYAVLTTKFFVGSFYTMARKNSTFKERADAAGELLGVVGMGALFHGVAGSPAMSVMFSAFDLALKAFGDDDDEEERRRRNPLTADDSEARFFFDWLPKYFGEIMVPGLDGRDHRLSDILANGPISELTNVNIGSRTAFNNMWWREGAPADTTAGSVLNGVISNVAGISLAQSIGNAYDDFSNGDYYRGLEKALPAFLKSWVTAERVRQEGVRTRADDTIIGRENISDTDLKALTMGFQLTNVAQAQKARATAKKQGQAAEKEKTSLQQQFNRTVLDMARGEADRADLEDVLVEIRKHNGKYMDEPYAITEDSLSRSFSSYMGKRKLMYMGTQYTADEAAYILPLLLAGNQE